MPCDFSRTNHHDPAVREKKGNPWGRNARHAMAFQNLQAVCANAIMRPKLQSCITTLCHEGRLKRRITHCVGELLQGTPSSRKHRPYDECTPTFEAPSREKGKGNPFAKGAATTVRLWALTAEWNCTSKARELLPKPQYAAPGSILLGWNSIACR